MFVDSKVPYVHTFLVLIVLDDYDDDDDDDDKVDIFVI